MEADRKREFRKVVIKDDTDRLRAELRRARPHVSVEEIESMSREDLVEVITELRLGKCKCKIRLTSISVTLRWLSVTPLTSRRRSHGRCGGNPEEAIEEEKKRLRWKKVSLEERTECS